ncbi:rho GTPase-activating protein 25 [Rhinophrynus dorsalis]
MSLKLPRSWEFNLKSDLGRIARSVSMMSNDQSALSSRLNNTLEKPVKSGWLKKQQKTFVKSWQQKYFALKGQQLYYYKELDDGKPQGSLFLPRSTVSQVSCSPDDAGKFIFEIIPGTSVDQNKSTPDPYVLMANSQAEMEEWVNAIKKAAGFPSGAVFGQRLVDTINYEKKYGCHLVPILMKKCADFIRERGLNEEGIFRLPGQDNLVKQLKEAFDAGERPSFSRDTDVHTVASLFKLYLRELPEPVIPWSQYEDCLNCEKMISIDEEKGHEDLMKQILLLPKENYNLLCFICRFLYEVQKNSSVNKMSVDNLAMVIGVNLLKPKTEEPEALMRSAPQIQKLMTVLISRHEKFFSKASDLPEDPVFQKTDNKKVQLSRSSVGWDAADENLSPGAELPRSQMRDSLSSSTSEEGLTSLEDDDSLSKDKQGSWKAIPRKRTQTLPITNRLIVGKNGDNVNNLKEEILRGDFWSSPVSNQPCLKSSPPGHKRTLSEEFDHHRTSTYDNVPSTQSYSGNDSGPCLNALSVRNGDGEQPIQQKQSLSYLKNFNSTRAESKDGNSYDMSPILMDLQREMENQKKQLEERIHSLEKENYEVWKKVLKLSEDLEKEKNKRMALEITLKNAEQSRNDAEKRNKHLEQEIQGFVSAMSQASSKPE